MLERQLPVLRDSCIPFGFLLTRSQHHAHELRWVARFAGDAVASVLSAGTPTTPVNNNESDAPLSRLVSPLVAEPDGMVVPMRFGFPRPYALRSLQAAPLRKLAADWWSQGLAKFAELCRRTHQDLVGSDSPPFTNWYEEPARNGEGLPVAAGV